MYALAPLAFFEVQQPRDRVERHVVAVMQGKDDALDLIEHFGQQHSKPFGGMQALGRIVRIVIAGNILERVLGFHDRRGSAQPVERFGAG